MLLHHNFVSSPRDSLCCRSYALTCTWTGLIWAYLECLCLSLLLAQTEHYGKELFGADETGRAIFPYMLRIKSTAKLEDPDNSVQVSRIWLRCCEVLSFSSRKKTSRCCSAVSFCKCSCLDYIILNFIVLSVWTKTGTFQERFCNVTSLWDYGTWKQEGDWRVLL